MKFKYIEIYGFKSFADRTRIDLEPGITAVVGPNGAGKSNIAEAIRWVLGEQSAHALRGEAMQDVIFNGTARRKPLSLSEVSLVLSNEDKALPIDYDEVVITRRLFRSGESQYLINKNECRLRDIHQLFMGTGIGTSAYSHIEQGAIDQVLDAKPEQRREIFEEAAGITRFKTKRREAMRKLEETDANLLRVRDIVQELDRQHQAIERQARKAQRFREKQERLMQLEKSLARTQAARIEQSRETFLSQSSELTRERQKLAESLAQAEVELETLRQRAREVEKRKSHLRAEHARLEGEQFRLQDRLAVLAEQRYETERSRDRAQSERTQWQSEIHRLEQRLSRGSAAGPAQENNLSDPQQALASLAGLQQRVGVLRQEQDQLKLRRLEEAARESELRNQSQEWRGRARAAEMALARLTQESDQLQKRLQQEQVRGRGIDEQLSCWTQQIKESEARFQAEEQSAEKAEKERVQIHAGWQQAQSKLETLQIQQSLASDLMKGSTQTGSVSGALWAQAIRAGLPAGIGVLGQLVKAQSGFETAVEAALGPLRWIWVIRDNASVRQWRKWLIERSPEIPVGLLSLEQASSIPDRPKRQGPGRPVTEFMTEAPDLGYGWQKLLQGIYVVENLRDLGGEQWPPAGERWVDSRGERMEGWGGWWWWPDNAGVSEAQVTQVLTECEELRQRYDRAVHACELIRQAHAQAHQKYQQIQSEGEKWLSEQKALEFARQQADRQMRVIEQESAGLQTEIAECQARAKQVSGELDKVLQAVAALESRQSDLSSERELLDEKRGTAVLSVRAGVSPSSGAMSEEGLHLFQEQLAKSQEFSADRSKQVTELSARLIDIGQRSDQTQQELKNVSQKVGAHQDQMVLLDAEELARSQDLELHEESHRQAVQSLQELKEKSHQMERKMDDLAFQESTLRERLRDLYQLDLSDIADVPTLVGDEEKAAAEIQLLRQELARMGPVNVAALEEEETLVQRIEFLNRQRADLDKAKRDVMEAIQKMNRTSRELFTQTFEAVQIAFKDFFRRLFGGGKAQLILMDEQNVLECGIDIIVHPPGKTPRSIALLSGGERALTAIALLFALFKVKPSPFCILDEIDAPLDEQNIGRFVQTLVEFTKLSQFIVITHNKKTIASADTLYGVTMQEAGISKLISVRLTSAGSDSSPSAVPPAIETDQPVMSAS